MRPQFIYLDLGNVIVWFDHAKAWQQMADLAGIDSVAVRAAATAGGLQESLERGHIDWPQFHSQFSSRTHTATDPEALAHAASDMFSLNIGMLPVIAGLERTGCPTGILSNTCAIHWEHLLAKHYSVLPGNFVQIVLSHLVALKKPERGIYELAAERSGVRPDQIFFCDDIPAHVDAARAAGWDAEIFVSAVGLADALDRRGINLGL